MPFIFPKNKEKFHIGCVCKRKGGAIRSSVIAILDWNSVRLFIRGLCFLRGGGGIGRGVIGGIS